MKVIGYIRVSTHQQDLDKQKHLLLEYAQAHQLMIQEFIHVQASSQKSQSERQIDELFQKLQPKDLLLVAELSRLGRNMLQTLNIINELSQKEVNIVFVHQPELSTTGAHTQLLLAIYGYFAETERTYISLRTKQGLAAAKARGAQLGRPKGSKNKKRVLDPFKKEILDYLKMGLNVASVMKVINPQLDQPITYNAYRYHIQHDNDLVEVWQRQKKSDL